VRRARKYKVAVIEYVDRALIIKRDNSTCYLWCKRKLQPEEITMDHIVPFSRGGSHTADNVRVACGPCNSRKGKKLLSELALEAA
jgi:5-methylcytosine-specific restriction endonuclease McrA